jgi:hypothetical protein
MECIILSVNDTYMDAQEVMHMTDYGIATIQHIRRAIHVFRFFMGTGIMLRYLSVVPTLGFEITRRCGNEQLTENGKISIIT